MNEGPSSPGSADETLCAELESFWSLATKAAKATRVYAANNEMLRRHLESAYTILASVFERHEALSFAVKEDRLIHDGAVVFRSDDRETGIPFLLYRNAFRRMTFVRGLAIEELAGFLSSIAADYSTFDQVGEDLVTALWRQSLPHFRYLTIDTLAFTAPGATQDGDRDELDRLQTEIEDIVARIYQTDAPAEDLVLGASITKEDLEALQQIRAEDEEDLDRLDIATARAIGAIDPLDIERMRASLLAETSELLIRKLLDIMVEVLFKEQSSQEFGMTMDLIQQLFDALLVQGRFKDATQLVMRIRERADGAPEPREKHVAHHLIRVFTMEGRVLGVLAAFNEYQSRSIQEVLDFLRALGPGVVPHLLAGLDTLMSPAHRRRVIELVLGYGVPDQQVLLLRMQGANSLLARDILQIASGLPEELLSPLVGIGLRHEHPKVREYAVGLLRSFPRGVSDRLALERLEDDDMDVRLAALRVVAARKDVDAGLILEQKLLADAFVELEAKEQRALALAFAQLVGPGAVVVLEKVLAPSLFSRPRMTDAQVAAAFGLSAIRSPAAVAVLERGARTFNARVREACRRSLGRDPEKPLTGDIDAPASSAAKENPDE